jgi:hypothetical protein
MFCSWSDTVLLLMDSNSSKSGKKPAQRDHGKERHERFRPADHQSENEQVDDGHRQDLGHRSPGQQRPGIVRECMESDRQEEVAGPDVNAAESEAHQELKEQ